VEGKSESEARMGDSEAKRSGKSLKISVKVNKK
jgi:hypothetical protein